MLPYVEGEAGRDRTSLSNHFISFYDMQSFELELDVLRTTLAYGFSTKRRNTYPNLSLAAKRSTFKATIVQK